MGTWNFRIYDDFSLGPYIGKVFHIVVIIVNMILFLNLVVAVLSETYSRFSKVKLGFYYDGVVDAISSVKYDKNYGALITAVPPFNIIMFFMVPIFMLTKNPRRLKSLNNAATLATFIPISGILIIIFAVLNICLIPFAYIFTLIHKGKLCMSLRIYKSRKEIVIDFLMFLLLGIVFLSLSQITDIYYFTKHLFFWKTEQLD